MKLRRARLTGALVDASLRTRVMAIAAILVALTSLLTGFLGTALLRSYLYIPVQPRRRPAKPLRRGR